MKKIFLDLGILIGIGIFLMSIFCFLHGSFEMYPTQEQTEKVRIAAIAVAGLCVFMSVMLIKSRLKLNGKKRDES